MIHLEAEHDMLIDGKVLADGSDATYTGTGGGSGGSIYLKARFLSGLYDKGTRHITEATVIIDTTSSININYCNNLVLYITSCVPLYHIAVDSHMLLLEYFASFYQDRLNVAMVAV